MKPGRRTSSDEAIVVGCSLTTQMRRLTGPRRLTEETARQIIASQWELAEKIRLCDHLIWNDGSTGRLHSRPRCAPGTCKVYLLLRHDQ